MTRGTESPNAGEFLRGQNGELIWNERFAETTASLSNNGEQRLRDLGIDPGRFVQNMAIDGARRLTSKKRVDDPKYIGSIGQVEYPDDPDMAERLIDIVTELMKAGELVVNYYGKPF